METSGTKGITKKGTTGWMEERKQRQRKEKSEAEGKKKVKKKEHCKDPKGDRRLMETTEKRTEERKNEGMERRGWMERGRKHETYKGSKGRWEKGGTEDGEEKHCSASVTLNTCLNSELCSVERTRAEFRRITQVDYTAPVVREFVNVLRSPTTSIHQERFLRSPWRQARKTKLSL